MTSYAMLQFDRISLNADVNLIVYHFYYCEHKVINVLSNARIE